jgi:type IV pilus assembly protein PilM
MFKRTYIGLEIRPDALNAIAVQRKGNQLILGGVGTQPLVEGTVVPRFSGVNVSCPDDFVEKVKVLLDPLQQRDNRIAVALPDQSGSLFLLDMQTPFKNRAEGDEIIRWHLKDLLPGKSNRLAVDYQVLEEKDTGAKRLLVAAMDQELLTHYEALFDQAGYAAVVIDFHSLALYNAYRSQIDFGQDFILIGIDGSQLSVQVFIGRTPVFQRSRSLQRDLQQVFRELNRSLIGCRSDLPVFNRLPVYLHSDWREEKLVEVVAELFDQPITELTSPVKKLINGHQVNFVDVDARALTAALGVAEQMMPGATG